MNAYYAEMAEADAERMEFLMEETGSIQETLEHHDFISLIPRWTKSDVPSVLRISAWTEMSQSFRADREPRF